MQLITLDDSLRQYTQQYTTAAALSDVHNKTNSEHTVAL